VSDPFLAEIRLFAGNFAPKGWAACDGQLLPINQNQALFSLLGTTYGGNGRTTFALPDLRGRVPMHTGVGPGLDARELGEMSGGESASPASGEPSVRTAPHTVLNFIIALQGIFPSRP
jgi:microcystin-dependent protein